MQLFFFPGILRLFHPLSGFVSLQPPIYSGHNPLNLECSRSPLCKAKESIQKRNELRDTLWQTYGNEIIDYCHQQHLKAPEQDQMAFDFEDDIIPF